MKRFGPTFSRFNPYPSLPSVLYRKQENGSNAWIKAYKQQHGPLFSEFNWHIVPHTFYFLIITIFIGIPSEGASAEERGIDIAPLTPQINKIVACHWYHKIPWLFHQLPQLTMHFAPCTMASFHEGTSHHE